MAEVVIHELAHQWFGNLVTMDWWDDLWLNEGFACWMQTYAADRLHPEWAMWPQFAKDPKMMAYFPDRYPKGKGPPREYFYNVLNTIHPDYLQQVLTHAAKQRMTAEGEGMERESIRIFAYWDEQLRSMPYLS